MGAVKLIIFRILRAQEELEGAGQVVEFHLPDAQVLPTLEAVAVVQGVVLLRAKQAVLVVPVSSS